MINYTPQNQLKIELFKHPFETELDKENRWVKLAAVIPWDKLAEVYSRKLQSGMGRKSVTVRTVLGALIVKHKLRLDDRGTIEMIKENIYFQYFCGLEEFTTKAVFDSSLFVDIRKRLGKEFEKFHRYIIEESENRKPHQARIKRKSQTKGKAENNSEGNSTKESDQPTEPKHRGTLKVDATVADQEIKYPNVVGLLNESRQQLEWMINELYDPFIDGFHPRLYPRKARKEYLIFSKKRKKTRNEIRRGIKGQLQYLRRDLNVIQNNKNDLQISNIYHISRYN